MEPNQTQTQAQTTAQNPAATGTQAQDAAQIAANPAAQTTTQAQEHVQLTRAEWDAIVADRATLGTLRQQTQATAEQAERARLDALAARGEGAQALNAQREQYEARVRTEQERYQALERQHLGRELSLTLADALTGADFVSQDAGLQLRQILEARFEAVRDQATGAVQVVDKISRRPAAEVAREFLASPSAGHFLKSKAGRGTSTGGQHGGTSTVDEPLSYEDQVMANWQQRQAAAGQAGWQLPIQQTLQKIG